MKPDSYKPYLRGTVALIGMAIGYCEGKPNSLSHVTAAQIVGATLICQYIFETANAYLSAYFAKKELNCQKQLNADQAIRQSAIIPGNNIEKVAARNTQHEQARVIQGLERKINNLESYKAEIPSQVGYSAINMTAGAVIGITLSQLPF